MEIKASPGDYIKLVLSKFREIEGNILESYDKDVVLIKLKSGYNIGISKDKIVDFRVIRKFKGKDKVVKIPIAKDKPSIGLIITGGTIASKLDPETGGVNSLTDTNELAKFYPGLFSKVNVKKLEIPFMMDSSSMTSKHWVKIAEIAKDMLNDKSIEGIIITHGTDTLHYTSAALSFFLKDLNKPVVLTYSQRSVDRASSDAELNLECAANFVLSDCAEVVVLGHASMEDDFCYAIRGTKARKMHTSRRDAFKSVNANPIAKVYSDKEGSKVEFLSERRPRNNDKVVLDAKFSDKVALVKFYPGQDAGILDYYKSKGYKGIILEVTGLGHLLTQDKEKKWVSKIKKLSKEGFLIFGAPQTIYGRLNPRVYSAGRELEKAGLICLEDILPETAFVKLGYAFGKSRNANTVKEIMLNNISGEFNELLTS